jgi:DNA-binding transcriptional LysR family regulator
VVDLNDIALFVHVVRAGSFAAASRRLGMPSNTVSRRVQGLEQQLGVRLLQRSTRQLTLTAAGSTLYQRSADQVEALVEAAREAEEGSQLPSGKIRVAAAADFFRWFQVAWISDFLAEHPKVRLEFVLSDDRVNLIDQGIDVAIRAGVESDSNLVARQIGTGRISLVASPDYLAGRGTPQSIAELSTHDCIVTPSASGQAVWKLTGPRGVEEIEVSGCFHANSMHVLLEAALTGLGISLLPTIATLPYLREGQLVEVLPEYSTGIVGIYLLYPSRRQLPRAVSAFIEFITTKMVDGGLVHPMPTLSGQPVT